MSADPRLEGPSPSRTTMASPSQAKCLRGGTLWYVSHGNGGLAFETCSRLTGSVPQVYFGFTRCPDICPEELDKMARILDMVYEEMPDSVVPLFVTCDPARDDPAALKSYLAEFHPALLGLTGTYEEIKAMCKAYRVYFSTPEHVKPGQDYLVDHSIYFYLMDPEGDFVEVLGRQHSPDQGAKLVLDHMKDWQRKSG